MSLERPSPSEVVMDEPVEVNRRFQSYLCREGILRMNFKGNREFKLILLIFNCIHPRTNL